MTGDHGLEDPIELRETLLLYIGTGGTSSEVRNAFEVEGRRCLMVGRSSCSVTFVELFHAGRLLSVALASNLFDEGELSGVRLCECLWEGVMGVWGAFPIK